MVTASTVELVTPPGAGGVILPSGCFVPASNPTKPNSRPISMPLLLCRIGDARAADHALEHPRPGPNNRASRHGRAAQPTAQK